jgi:HD-GYP domain-containing protein (c-di-GMP phosphodiesterase class II)
LAEAVDAKDRYTRGHSQRVAEYAKALAQASGYDEGFVELVYVSGTLHDVGKIGVPDEVLKKTSRLTDEEFAQIKLHPELGEKIVMQIPELRDTLPGVRSHHERYDGRGYPDRLAGEQIPLIARILSIADAFDAMTSDRSYREGMTFEHALSQIREGSGSQFDPDLAATFVAMMESDRQVA